LSSINDLSAYLASFYGGGFVILNHNLWVQRRTGGGNMMAATLPDPAQTVAKTDPDIYGWPVKTTDRASAHVPFLSDACFSGYGSAGGVNTDNINVTGHNGALVAARKTSGHAFGKSLGYFSVNLVFADGHVASHKKQAIRGVYNGDTGSGWFY
jgi:prepilin-type processing-associated H-X9-DG protein